MSSSPELQGPSPSYVQFVDMLYSVVIGMGFRDLATNMGLAKSPWGLWTLQGFLFFFVLVIVTRDWVSYHKLIKKRMHIGNMRFVIDIAILLSFYLMMLTATSLSVEMPMFALYAAAYSLFLLFWEIGELFEHGNDREVKREFVWNLVYIALFGGWAVLAWNSSQWASEKAAAGVFAAFLVLATVQWRMAPSS